MKLFLKIFIAVFIISLSCFTSDAERTNTLSVKVTVFEMYGKPFEYAGNSFFNALFNPVFKETEK